MAAGLMRRDISRYNLAREPLAITETDTAGSGCCSSDGSTASKCC
jgi:hypothetical protein